MNDNQKGYLMRLFKSGIIIIGSIIIWLLSLLPSNLKIVLSLMAILAFCLGCMDILINLITVFNNPDYFKSEIRFL